MHNGVQLYVPGGGQGVPSPPKEKDRRRLSFAGLSLFVELDGRGANDENHACCRL